MHTGLSVHPGASVPLVLAGGGGHAKVVLDAARASGWRIAGFLDDAPEAALASLGVERLGSITDWSRCETACRFIPAIGDNAARRACIEPILRHGGDRLALVVHPTAVISRLHVLLEPGVFISAGAIVNPCARIGAGAIINSGAIVEHDVEIGAWSHVGPDRKSVV